MDIRIPDVAPQNIGKWMFTYCNYCHLQTRLMNQSTALGTHLYTGVLDCLSKTIRREGWSALYKGFVPNYMRLGPWNVVVCYNEHGL